MVKQTIFSVRVLRHIFHSITILFKGYTETFQYKLDVTGDV